MAKPILKAIATGKTAPFRTSVTKQMADASGATVVIEGPYETLDALTSAQIDALLPAGYTRETATLDPAGEGMGKLTVRTVAFDNPAAEGLEPVRTTFRISMQEVQYDLEDHPHLAGARDKILKWLATDETVRVDGNNYYWQDPNGDLHQINDAAAIQFIEAYMAGIKTFVRYYPVITKISTWKNPPGVTMSGRSFTSGTPPFSQGIGGFDNPPLTLSGYPSGYWFKSGDEWTNNGDRTWSREEQWTYTPEGSGGSHAWIYNSRGGAQ